MTDLLLPDVRIKQAALKLMDNTGRFTSPLTGTVRTVARPGDRWGVRLDYGDLTTLDRARIESLIANQRGAVNRVLFSPPDYVQRGSFPSQELYLNNGFTNGTTGFNTAAGASMAVVDRRLRLTFNGAGPAQLVASVTNLTLNMPFVARYFFADGKGTPLALGAMASYCSGSSISNSVVSLAGLTVVPMVLDMNGPTIESVLYPSAGAVNIPTGQIAGNYVDVLWISMSQCMLVDNGPNILLQSDSMASPWAANACSITANSATAADNTATAATLFDTTANTTHYVSQAVTLSSSGVDYMLCAELKAGTQPNAWLEMVETTGSTVVAYEFNLSTGAKNQLGVGANWANARAFSVPLGNGWWYCCILGRKTNAATGGAIYWGAANAAGATSYAGTGGAATYARRVTFSQSSVPARQVQSVSAAVPPTPQTGSALYVKGLPASVSGLLLPGDWVQVTNVASGTMELKRVTAQLDSDAAGRGYLQFSPPIRTSPTDNDPVIVNAPMGRFILTATDNGWTSVPGPNGNPLATYSLDFAESST